MKTIHKYGLDICNDQLIEMPCGGKILDVQVQYNDLQLWALVNPSLPLQKRQIRIHGTGHDVSNDEHLDYISTFQVHGGNLVFHVFEYIK